MQLQSAPLYPEKWVAQYHLFLEALTLNFVLTFTWEDTLQGLIRQ